MTDSVIGLSAALGALIVLSTEILSASGALTGGPGKLLWLCVFFLGWHQRRFFFPGDSPRKTPRALPGIAGLVCGTVLLVCLITALVSPPNNYDSMTYHLPRVMRWLANHRVAHYLTADSRRLYYAPFAEYAALHLHLLFGNDLTWNLIQWAALAGSLVLSHSIAERLAPRQGAGPLAACLAVTTPMAILQASSTQNDLVVAYWLLCLAYLVFFAHPVCGARQALLIGTCAGLAIFTKGSAYLFGLPLAAVWSGRLWREGARRALLCVFLAVAAIGLLNGPHWIRNVRDFGTPGGDVTRLLMRPSPSRVLASAVKNATLQLITPWPRWNQLVTAGSRASLRMLSIDPDDKPTNLHGLTFQLPDFYNHEDTAGNPLHFALLALAIPAIFFRGRRKLLRVYAAVVVAAALLFCALLKWQPWNSRLQLPLFLLAYPLAAASLTRILSTKKRAAVFCVVLLLASLPYLLLNRSRPWLGRGARLGIFEESRDNLLFYNARAIRGDYVRGIAVLGDTGCRDVGLFEQGNSFEYPLWALGHQRLGAAFRLIELAGDPTRDPIVPCAIVFLRQPAGEVFSYGAKNYRRIFSSKTLAVYFPGS